jgi:hypothetical protein
VDDTSLSKLAQTLPSVLSLSVEQNLKPKLAWLQRRLVLDDASLSVVVQRMPTLLQLNVESNLEPTMTFYEECVGLDTARTHIAKHSSLWTASLDNRLKPRLAEVQAAGVPIDTGTISRMAQHTKDRWSNGLASHKRKNNN